MGILKKAALVFFSLFAIMTAVPFFYANRAKIFERIESVPECDVICLLGARVYAGGVLSPVLKQRCDASVMLYKAGICGTIFVSGSGKYEVNNIVRYLMESGITEKKIQKDYFGYNTHDTIRHLKDRDFAYPLLVSQSFHLYRAIEMSHDEGLDASGLAAEKVAPLSEELSFFDKLSIRVKRHYTGSVLLVLYKMGLYDTLSDVSEMSRKKIIAH